MLDEKSEERGMQIKHKVGEPVKADSRDWIRVSRKRFDARTRFNIPNANTFIE